MLTYAQLRELYSQAVAGIEVSRTLTDASETYRGDGIGFGPIVNAGPARNDYIAGQGGDDAVSGYGGSDIVVGGIGNDVVSGGPGAAPTFTVDSADWLFGDAIGLRANDGSSGDGNDTIAGNKGGDFIFGGGGEDFLLGSNFGNSSLSGNDYLSGGTGDDILIGGDGNDQLEGGTTTRISLNMASTVNPPEPPTEPIESDLARMLIGAGDGYRYSWDETSQCVRYEVLNGNSSNDVIEIDELRNVEFSRVSTDPTEVIDVNPDALSETEPLTKWTVDILRYANGAGVLRLLCNGEEVKGSVSSSEDFADDGATALAKGVGAGKFAFDDTTPIAAGTYQAIYRTDARVGKTIGDAPGALELLGTDGRRAIQIHSLGDKAQGTSASEGCYTITNKAVQSIENLILAFAPDVTELSATSTSMGAGHGITSGPVKYWDLFWRDTSRSESEWKSQIEVVLRNAEHIEQPTLTFDAPTRSENRVTFNVDIDDGGDDALSKPLQLDISISGVGDAVIGKTLIIKAGETSGDFSVRLPAGATGTVSAEITAVTPLNGKNTYGEYSSSSADKARLRDLFFEDPGEDRSVKYELTPLKIINFEADERMVEDASLL